MNYSIATRRAILAGREPAWVTNHSRAPYVRNLILATPDWVNRRALSAIRRQAARRSYATRTRWVADHIVPLTHPLVCGLNVPWNLRIITSLENARRSNRWWEWTADLFEHPEQLSMAL